MEALVPGIILLLLLWTIRDRWPRGIYPRYGYRSRRSLSSPEAWNAAHWMMSEILWWGGWLVLNTGITCWLLDLSSAAASAVVGAVTLLLFAGAIAFTERHLARRFDEQGKPIERPVDSE